MANTSPWIAYREYDVDDETGTVDRSYLRGTTAFGSASLTNDPTDAAQYGSKQAALDAIKAAYPRKVPGVRKGAVRADGAPPGGTTHHH